MKEFVATAIGWLKNQSFSATDLPSQARDYIYDEAPGNWNASQKELALKQVLAEFGDQHPASQPPPAAVTAVRRPAIIDKPRAGKENRDPPIPDLHKSPYRFVTIPAGVVPAPPEVKTAALDAPLARGVCGTITVEWAVETPILIGVAEGAGAQEISVPMQLGRNGPFVIPGATLRGMMRSAMEIVCRARLTQVNTHHRYPLRDFTHSAYKARTTARAAGDPSPIHAGWLRKTSGGYTITPCDYRLIRIRDFLVLFGLAKKGQALGDAHLNWLLKDTTAKYKAADMIDSSSRLFKFDPESDTFQDCVREDSKNDCVPSRSGRTGVYVFSGITPSLGQGVTGAVLDAEDDLRRPGLKKKRECVFFDRRGAVPVPLSDDAFDRFEQMNCVPSKNGRTPTGTYELLMPTLDAGQRIPVFFTGDLNNQEKLEIGLTRLFKIGHGHGVGDKLAAEAGHSPNPANPDMVEALFGHVFEPTDLGLERNATPPREAARKGRIAFGFAKLTNPQDAATDGGDVTAVMMGPRASFAPFYLKGQYKDWSDPDSRLAGRKRYFPRFSNGNLPGAFGQIEQTLAPSGQAAQNSDMVSCLRFLEPKYANATLNFSGKIKLHNVLPEEVGALLWALTHGGDPAKPYRHMIGRAKNAGAGQTRVQSVTLNLERNDGGIVEMTGTGNWEEAWTTSGAQSLAPYLAAFDAYMKAQTRTPAWPAVDEIAEFLGCSRPGAVSAVKSTYPVLEDFAAVRKTTKHGNQRAPNANANDRYLDTPRVETVVTPYR